MGSSMALLMVWLGSMQTRETEGDSRQRMLEHHGVGLSTLTSVQSATYCSNAANSLFDVCLLVLGGWAFGLVSLYHPF